MPGRSGKSKCICRTVRFTTNNEEKPHGTARRLQRRTGLKEADAANKRITPKRILNKQQNFYKIFFYGSMMLFTLIFLLCALFTQGTSFRGLFFSDTSDSFMDHYNSMVYNEIDPYENKVIYPPLATLTYRLCLELVPQDDYVTVVSDPTVKSQPRSIHLGQSFIFQFILFAVITGIIFFVAVDCLKKGRTGEKFGFLLLYMMSTPFLFMIERGNNIIIPLSFSIFFLAFYDSEKKALREFALISLAIAVGFKIYPLVFAMLLIRNKQYKELLRTGLYCFITLILPFFIFYNGFASMKMMLTNIVGFGSKRSSAGNLDAQLDFQRIFYFIYYGTRKVTGLTITDTALASYAGLFRYLITGICVIGTFFLKKRWQIVMLCAAILYGYPGSCSTYLLVFMMLGIILFLDEEKIFSLKNFLYLGLMTLTQVPLTLQAGGGWNRYWTTKITSIAVLCLVLLALFDMLLNFFSWNEKRKICGVRRKDALLCVFADFLPEKAAQKFFRSHPALTAAKNLTVTAVSAGAAVSGNEEVPE